MHDQSDPRPGPPDFWSTRYAVGVPVIGSVAGYFLLTEHLAHVLLSGRLQSRFPGLDLLAHDTGHLWWTLLGEQGNPHFGVLHVASYIALGYGFYLLSSAWNVLYHAQRHDILTTTGPYARIRHPQYVAFVLILTGFLLQWPTLLTLSMFPILLLMYGRLALTEEHEMQQRFGARYVTYAQKTPRFVPRLRAARHDVAER